MFNQIKQMFSRAKSIDMKTERIRSDSWMNGYTGLGQGGRDKATGTFFAACRVFSLIELDDLYAASGITRRIIDIVASDMTRQGWEVDGDPEGAIVSQLEEMQAYAKITQLIQWSRLYGGAAILLGIVDGRPLDMPVNENNIQEIAWMQVYDRYQCVVQRDYICNDFNSCNYGCPDFYQINDSWTGNTFLVHHSRILRMDWGTLSPRERNRNNGWCDSAIVPIYEELKNLGAAFGNMSTIMHDFVNGVIKIPGLSQMISTSCSENENLLMRRLNFANMTKGAQGMMVLDGEESFEKLSTNVAGLSEMLDRFMLSVCSVTGIPATLLFGRSPAGLNATGDAETRNYYDMIKQYQEMKLKPVLEKLTYYLMRSINGPFNGVEPENWSIQFAPLWQNTEEQEAAMRRTVAETDAIYIDRGVLDANEVAISRFGGDRWSMNTLIDVKARENGYDPEEIADLEYKKAQEIKEMPPEAAIGPSDDDDNEIIVVR